MRRIKMVLAMASIAVLLAAFAAPAMARDFNHHFLNNGFNDNSVFQSNEQEVQSGDSSQSYNVTGGGDNSNACQGIQGISNTGNAVNNTSVLQAHPFNDQFDNRFFDNKFDNGFNGGDVEIQDTGNFTLNPTSTITCDQQVNQAASASG